MSLASRLPWRARLRQSWQAQAPRERLMLATALGLVAAALAWWIALAPALGTLREAPGQHQLLDTQLQQMRALQAQAQAIQSQPRMGRAEAQRALEAATRQYLGTGTRITVSGDNLVLTLTGVSGEALAQWLGQARVNARAVPSEARLNRNASGSWDGNLVMSLPPR